MNVVLKNRIYRPAHLQVREKNLRASEVLERVLNGGIVIEDSIRDAGTGVDIVRSQSYFIVANIEDGYQRDATRRF
jgi:hypothetical protein